MYSQRFHSGVAMFKFNPLQKPSLAQVNQDLLYQAERDRINAAYNLEHFQHELTKLDERIARLRKELNTTDKVVGIEKGRKQ